MKPDLALTALEAVRRDHRSGHTCTDGKWYNETLSGGTRPKCPTALHLDTATVQVRKLADQVHEAAHQPRHVDAVTAAMTATPLSEMNPEAVEQWRGLARQGIEALSWSLENNDATTDRARRIMERVTR